MTIPRYTKLSTKIALYGTVAAIALALSPIDFDPLQPSQAEAAGQGKQSSNSSGNSGGGGGGSSNGGNSNAGSGSGNSNAGSDNAKASNGSGSSSGQGASSGGGASTSGGSANSGGANAKAGTSGGTNVATAGGAAADDTNQTLQDLFADVTGTEDEESDSPEWAKQPGGKGGAGGGQPATSGTTKGDLFGDLFVIARDVNGIPILSPEGFVQPIDANGNFIALDEDGHPVDETLTLEVELGRLNVGRAPTQVLDRRADEIIDLMQNATDLTTDPAGRLVFTVDGVEKTIDSPLENLAIYKALMTTGTIPGVTDLPGTAFDYLVDGKKTAEDLAASAVFLAAATDKTGVFTDDEIAYLNTFLDIETQSIGSVTYSNIDYSSISYDRETTYGTVTTDVLVLQSDGSWVPTNINVFDVVFGGVSASDAGSLSAYTLAADDARTIVNFIHEYEIPAVDLASVTH